MNTNEARCPDCGGEFDIETDVTVSEPNGDGPRTFRVAAAVAFCTACPFIHEIQTHLRGARRVTVGVRLADLPTEQRPTQK